jgi:nucleoside-diphosphate-sugar epimerase
MKRILITGANGFVGSFLVEGGLKHKHEIYAGVRQTSNLEYLNNKKAKILYLDLSDKEKLKTEWRNLKLNIERFDHVIHCAGAVAAKDSNEFNQVNNIFTQNLYNSLVEAKFMPGSFVFISSMAVNGPGNRYNLSPVKLSDIPNPITEYGRSKLAAENFLKASGEIPYLIFRPTGIYGPRDKGYLTFFKLLSQHLILYPGSSNQLLSFIYVKDLTGIIYLALNSRICNRTYIVSDGENYTCKEFANLAKQTLRKWAVPVYVPKPLAKWIAAISEKQAMRKDRISLLNRDKYKELTSKNWSCSSDELQVDFNFVPRYSLKKGIEETVHWYLSNKWL